MKDYKYICNNENCPPRIAGCPTPFMSNENEKCVFCGHELVENVPGLKFIEKIKFVAIDSAGKIMSKEEWEEHKKSEKEIYR